MNIGMNNLGPVTETELIARSTSPRVTEEQLNANIDKVFVYNAAEAAVAVGAPFDPALQYLTLCILTLKNGFTVTGESACAVPENYKKDVGERLAIANAKNKVWGLMGYELKTKVAMVAAAPVASDPLAKTYIGTKVVHALPMNRRDYNTLRGWELPADEDGDDEGYLVEYADGGQANVGGFTGYVSWSPKAVFEQSYHTL